MTVWSFPTRIVFGAGEAAGTGGAARDSGLRRALLVTDPGVLRAGLCDRVRASLERAGVVVAVFSDIEGNPTEANIEAGAAAFRQHAADGAVSVGGGSAIDAAKLIALRARTDLPFEQLDDAVDGGRHVPADVPPTIALPTTAGTGSEVGRSGVLTVRSTGRKTVVFSPHLLPRTAILDPELTVSMPPHVTAATGFDALTHNIEAYLSLGDHPLADAIALGGVELVVSHLERAVRDGGDLAARGAMMKAAMMGAIAFQKGLGACHSLAHPLSSECGLHHGLANALCLPAVIDFNEPSAAERVQRLAALFGAGGGAGELGAAVRRLRAAVGIADGLASAGVRSEQLEPLADKALEDACHRSNPRPCTRADLLALYRASL